MNAKLKKALGLNRPRLTLAILLLGVAIHFAFPRYVVATESMVPTIPPGSLVVAMNTSLLPVRIGKNDIAVFEPVRNVSPEPWMHRIVAVPGDRFDAPDRIGRVDVSEDGNASPAREGGNPLTIPESSFYQSGDTAHSYHGLVPEKLVTGKVLFHFKPPWR